jgi:hypothetical protein
MLCSSLVVMLCNFLMNFILLYYVSLSVTTVCTSCWNESDLYAPLLWVVYLHFWINLLESVVNCSVAFFLVYVCLES